MYWQTSRAMYKFLDLTRRAHEKKSSTQAKFNFTVCLKIPHMIIPDLLLHFHYILWKKIVLTNFLNSTKYSVSFNFDLFDVRSHFKQYLLILITIGCTVATSNPFATFYGPKGISWTKRDGSSLCVPISHSYVYYRCTVLFKFIMKYL